MPTRDHGRVRSRERPPAQIAVDRDAGTAAMQTENQTKSQDLVLWDGKCGFCRRGVRWFERRDLTHRMKMVPYQQAPSPPMTPELARACDRALYIVHPDGSMTRAGRAILHMLALTGHPRLARWLAFPPFVWAVEIGYWLVARNRQIASRLFFTREDQ